MTCVPSASDTRNEQHTSSIQPSVQHAHASARDAVSAGTCGGTAETEREDFCSGDGTRCFPEMAVEKCHYRVFPRADGGDVHVFVI